MAVAYKMIIPFKGSDVKFGDFFIKNPCFSLVDLFKWMAGYAFKEACQFPYFRVRGYSDNIETHNFNGLDMFSPSSDIFILPLTYKALARSGRTFLVKRNGALSMTGINQWWDSKLIGTELIIPGLYYDELSDVYRSFICTKDGWVAFTCQDIVEHCKKFKTVMEVANYINQRTEKGHAKLIENYRQQRHTIRKRNKFDHIYLNRAV